MLCIVLPTAIPATKIAAAAATIEPVFFTIASSSFLITLLLRVACVGHDEAAAALRADRDFAGGRVVEVGDRRFGDVVRAVAAGRVMKLPEILEARRTAHGAP